MSGASGRAGRHAGGHRPATPGFVRRMGRAAGRGLLFAGLVLLAACAHLAPVQDAGVVAGARQLVLVVTPDWDADTGTLQRFARDDRGHWVVQGPAVAVVVGRAGSAWGLGLHPPRNDGPVKREGDGRAPAGVFGIGEAFGYAPGAATALPYAPMRASHWCMDVVGSPLYNRIVDATVVGAAAVEGSTEPMRRDLHVDGDQRYRLGFTIDHNPAAVQGAGSCIFAHLWKSPTTPTAGCTAMDAAAMQALLGWLRPEAQPVFVLLPQPQYRALHRAWGLPPPARTGP